MMRYIVWHLLFLTFELFISSSIGQDIEFDAGVSTSVVKNEKNEVEKWNDVRGSDHGSMYAPSNAKPVLVEPKESRQYLQFSGSEYFILNSTTSIYMETSRTGSTLTMVVKSDSRQLNTILGEWSYCCCCHCSI